MKTPHIHPSCSMYCAYSAEAEYMICRISAFQKIVRTIAVQFSLPRLTWCWVLST